MNMKDVIQARINELQRPQSPTIKANIPAKNSPSEFENIIKQKLNSREIRNDINSTAVNSKANENADKTMVNEVKAPSFSKHAAERLSYRNIEITEEFIGRMEEALQKASSKGIKNALMISGDSAFIVNVDSKTVITAMNMDDMRNNIITNIDGTVIM